MKYSWRQITCRCLVLTCPLFAALVVSRVVAAQSQEQASRPVVVSAQMVKRTLIYKVNGKIVEDSPKNSLLTNLGNIAIARGLKIPVFIIVDVRAPFSEVGKLETALDKIDLTYSRRLFVTDFRDGKMNEIHWDNTPIPIPQN
jgi:hypothetical protein